MGVRFQGKEVGDRKYEGENRSTGTGRVKWLGMGEYGREGVYKRITIYDLAREELKQVSTTMHGFHLMEFSLYPKKRWFEENNYKYHYIYVPMLVKVIVLKKCNEY